MAVRALPQAQPEAPPVQDILPPEPKKIPEPKPQVEVTRGDPSPSLEDLFANSRSLMNKKRKEKAAQKVNLSTIKLITMILHF